MQTDIGLINIVIAAVLWAGVLGSALIAGVFFAFSTFIMRAFSRIEEDAAVAAMNSINTVILGSLFMPVFFGTAIAGLILIVAALFGSGPAALAALAGSTVYIVGVIVVTIVFNVPLNNALGRSADIWPDYLRRWTFWNHVRTIASLIACALFVLTLSP